MSAFYFESIDAFLSIDNDNIVGNLTKHYSNDFSSQKSQLTKSWISSIEILKKSFGLIEKQISNINDWTILLEYQIPRRSKRIDAVLLSTHLIYVIEFKIGQEKYLTNDVQQIEDYALDLRDFHLESRSKRIIPILIATGASDFQNKLEDNDDFVWNVIKSNGKDLAQIILSVEAKEVLSNSSIDAIAWNNSPYSPTPTIVEAARVLYTGQSVESISHNQAGKINLSKTTDAVLDAIASAKKDKKKVICFITGVPGAGKTLAGLNIVHKNEVTDDKKDIAVFLSGNGPLIKVLTESLARDLSKRQKIKKNVAVREVKTFIQNGHAFIDDHYSDKKRVSEEHIVIYDEAQRAWTKERKNKKSNGQINESEPDILLGIMDRKPDWAVLIALVGGGQEINTGEAGLSEWGRSLAQRFNHWTIYISKELKVGNHSTGNTKLFEQTPNHLEVVESSDLHLGTSIRAYKAEALSHWVDLVLENNPKEAHRLFKTQLIDYPIFITRNMSEARKWLLSKTRGTRRAGLLASSGGRRLRALGFDPYFGLKGTSTPEELGAWFLNGKQDVRSSNFLEIVATEFAVQGLEIDRAGLMWDADLRIENHKWSYFKFNGFRWQKVRLETNRRYLLNKYRVLLTRAREGMIIICPSGSADDITRLPEFYDQTYDNLSQCGIPTLNEDTVIKKI